jgi:hypothetical protein
MVDTPLDLRSTISVHSAPLFLSVLFAAAVPRSNLMTRAKLALKVFRRLL